MVVDDEARDIAASPLRGRGPVPEVVVPDPGSMFRWHEHDYPHPLARWHSHPEIEIHLIRAGTGLGFVGDHIGRFEAGHLVLVGSDLPHNWISELEEGQQLPGRDVVLQIHPERMEALAHVAPEAREVVALVRDAARGIEFFGAPASTAAMHLEAVGVTRGSARLAHLFSLFETLAAATPEFRRLLSSAAPLPPADMNAHLKVDAVIRFITEHLDSAVRLGDAAAHVGMTPSALSRFFRRTAGRGFTETVRRLRVIRACTLLEETTLPIADICYSSGFQNLSNFNRQFRAETGTTPGAYRRASSGREAVGHLG